MTKFAVLSCVALVVLSACSPATFLSPKTAFDERDLVAAPDYESLESWAAFPGKESKALLSPPGEESRQAEAEADVFYIYPTVWINRRVWNDRLDSEKAQETLFEIVLPGQASVFNDCCRVFVPLYRQASISAFFTEPEEAEPAFAVAFGDLERAFAVFLEHNGERPFIIAAHSQGTMHALRLLEQVDRDPELRERLVAAYVPGFAVPLPLYEDRFEHLRPCETPQQTGCALSWDTYSEGTPPDMAETLMHWHGDALHRYPTDTARQCTNPVTWQNDEEPSAKEDHLGAVRLINEGRKASFWRVILSRNAVGMNVTGLEEPRQAMMSVRCEDGVLRVPDVRRLDYPPPQTSRGNYHLGDYELFYMDVRKNAVLRTEQWLEQRAAEEP